MECLFTRAVSYDDMSEYITLLNKNNIYYRYNIYEDENGDTCFKYYVKLEDLENIIKAVDCDVIVHRKSKYQKETEIEIYDDFIE